MDIVKLLREQAAEIAAEGHLGWGNTMLEAAREIESLQSQAAQHSVQSDVCPSCGVDDWAYGDDTNTFEVCAMCGKRR